MAKPQEAVSTREAIIKASAQRFGMSKKAMKKAVREATVRLAAEKIAREQLDSAWEEVIALSNQPPKRKK